MPRFIVGPIDGAAEPDGEPHVLIEANIGEGVTSAPLSKYFPYHTRLCRPVGLSFEDRTTVCRYAINRIGFGYDTKNILDLMRYLIPLPIPQRWRRRMIAFGSGDPTKIICSALIAQAFDAVRYPILPKITRAGSRQARREILHIRDSSLYMPRDFDISPYFEIVKPTIVQGFDYTALHWADKQKPLQEVAGEFGLFPETIVSPPLVPEEIDEEAPIPAEEVTSRPTTRRWSSASPSRSISWSSNMFRSAAPGCARERRKWPRRTRARMAFSTSWPGRHRAPAIIPECLLR